MKRMNSVLVLAGLTIASLMMAVGLAHAADKPRYARVSESTGEVWVLRAGADEWEPAGVNTPLGESDVAETESESYAEIQLDNGTIISLNEDTRVDFDALSFGSPDAKKTVLNLPYGSLAIKVPSYEDLAEYLIIELPNGRINVDSNTMLRVDVKGSKRSEVMVYRGQVRLESGDKSLVVKGGRQVSIDPDGVFGALKKLDKGRDYFDSWYSQKYDKYRDSESRDYLGGNAAYAGGYELDHSGAWMYVPEYGYCWRPHVEDDWYPYYDGYWAWSIHWGWTWVSYEPWGWIPYHYGRWVYSWGWGWVWVPGDVWGPAWVVWVYNGDCIGWAPMCPWDNPCYCGHHGHCHGPWTYVYRESFYHHGKWPKGHGKYKHDYDWGEKRYRYKDEKPFTAADYKKTGPEAPQVAVSKGNAGSTGMTSPATKQQVTAASRSLPQKQESALIKNNGKKVILEQKVTVNEAKGHTEYVSDKKTERALPPKPTVYETPASDRSDESTRDSNNGSTGASMTRGTESEKKVSEDKADNGFFSTQTYGDENKTYKQQEPNRTRPDEDEENQKKSKQSKKDENGRASEDKQEKRTGSMR
jgi:hypothetical protein